MFIIIIIYEFTTLIFMPILDFNFYLELHIIIEIFFISIYFIIINYKNLLINNKNNSLF